MLSSGKRHLLDRHTRHPGTPWSVSEITRQEHKCWERGKQVLRVGSLLLGQIHPHQDHGCSFPGVSQVISDLLHVTDRAKRLSKLEFREWAEVQGRGVKGLGLTPSGTGSEACMCTPFFTGTCDTSCLRLSQYPALASGVCMCVCVHTLNREAPDTRRKETSGSQTFHSHNQGAPEKWMYPATGSPFSPVLAETPCLEPVGRRR